MDMTNDVARALEGQWHKLCAVLLDIATREHGAGAKPSVDITLDDLRRLEGRTIVVTEVRGDAGVASALRVELTTQAEADEREREWRRRTL
jgi:hypothetical protein